MMGLGTVSFSRGEAHHVVKHACDVAWRNDCRWQRRWSGTPGGGRPLRLYRSAMSADDRIQGHIWEARGVRGSGFWPRWRGVASQLIARRKSRAASAIMESRANRSDRRHAPRDEIKTEP